MPPNRYDLVKDDHDVGVHPLYPDPAFEIGITFQAKLIGWQDVSRPTNQTEIVHAMRRIRYEGKIQNIKKKKVTIEISVDGLKVCLKRKKQKKKEFNDTNNEIVLMNHPIYRIFYVSHDSSDLKIFSYIARDGSTDNFTCSVFKSSKKSQAMKIVRTVGQAFEICHKKSVEKMDEQSMVTDDNISEDNDLDSSFKDDDLKKEIADEILNATDEKENRYQNGSNNNSSNKTKNKNNTNNNGSVHTLKLSPIITDSINRDSMKNSNINNSYNHNDNNPTPLSPNKETQRLRDLLEQQTMQTQHALEQLIIVRNQLMAETNARIEAQVKVQQLVQQNRELLEHITTVGNYHDAEKLVTGAPLSMQPQSPLPMYLPYDQNLGAKLQNQKWNHPSPFGINMANAQKYNQDLYSINQEILNQLQNINMNHNGGYNTVSPTLLGKMQISPYLSPMQNHSLASSFNSNNSGNNINKFNENNSIINDNSNIVNHNSNNSSHDKINNSDTTTSMSSIISKQTPSPMDMLLHMNHSYSNSIDGINFESSDDSLFIKPLSQVGTLTTLDSDGKIKVVVPITKPNCSNSLTNDIPVQRRKEKKVTLPEIVTFRVTDEKGNVINTNTKKLPATPTNITRSTSEKVPNRSQVQRTTWARHTTK